MKQPFHFADEKELFAHIFKLSSELTGDLERSREGSSRIVAKQPARSADTRSAVRLELHARAAAASCGTPTKTQA